MKTLYIYCYLLLFASIFSCQNAKKPTEKETVVAAKDTLASNNQIVNNADLTEDSTEIDAYANYQVIVIDTNANYDQLHQKMFQLKDKLNMTVDSMGRYYNRKRDLIVLPEDDEDQVYAGEYFPRKDLSETLSLDYMEQYRPNSKPKTIGIIAGIYENASSADSALKAIQKVEAKAFKLNSRIYIGCMH